MNAVLVVDKPSGLTSHDVVNRVRRILGERSVGHLGTLDPMATGVLALVAGSFTRLAQFYASSEKCYEGVIRFGYATDTYDAEGETTSTPQTVQLSAGKITELAGRFSGVVEQLPPPFSAKKIQGVPAYKLARKRQEVVLKPVKVEIKEFAITRLESDRAHFRAHVSSGTYLRSIAHDMGQLMGCGAHLASLRRTVLGEFNLAEAHTLEALQEGAASGQLDAALIHPRKLLPQLPCVTADEDGVACIRNGRALNLPEFSQAPMVKVFASQKDLIALATRIAGTLFHPKIVLAGALQPEYAAKR
ncbi:MAG TPA: tRNA pseudouridine(55) synthase TruB [Terriglobales bacterium]|jgi:tRNA pseudouridine55 synthase